MTEIEVHTNWNDSGYDCDHCGGRILKRIDRETGQPEQICYQCEACSCQWTLAGDVIRVGHLGSCRRAQREREASRQGDSRFPIPTLVMVLGVIVILLILVALGGVVAIRFLIPIAIFAFVVTAVYRFGRERMWW